MKTTTKKPLLERDVEKYLVKQVKAAGGEVRKLRWIGRTSAPDRLVLLPGVGCFVELKRPGKRPTAAQERELGALCASGLYSDNVNSKAEVDWLIARLQALSSGW
jgi:hypothetical protein